MKALIDTCIIIDVFQKRNPFYKAAMDIFLAVSNRQFLGILTAKSLSDIYYVLSKNIHSESEVRKILHILFTLFDVEDTYAVDCQIALNSPMKDYEDAVMVQTTKRIRAKYIVTRNLKDYKYSDVTTLSPEQFLGIILNPSN